MAKGSGLGDQLYIDGYDLGGSIQTLTRIAGGPAPLDLTAITQSAYERTGAKRDGGLDFVSYFDPAANANHARLSTLPTTDIVVTYGHGTALGNAAASLVAKQVNYDPQHGDDGSFLFTVNAAANAYGLEWGRQLTAGKRTDTGATSGTSLDFGAGFAFGAQAYIHIFAFSGTDATILIQASSDNAVGDPFAEPSGGFAHTVTGAHTSVRLATTSAIERYVRVATVTSGGFTNLQFLVAVTVNQTAVSF